MIGKLMLALGILAVTTGPVQAAMPAATWQARDHDFRAEHERFERAEQFREHGEHFQRFNEPHRFGLASNPQCYWQSAYWVKQVYPNGYGGVAYVPQYIPGQWICY